jgi:undecaprenyl-diphosphatase
MLSAGLSMLEALNAADIRLFHLVNIEWTHPALDAFFTFVTEFKTTMPLVALLAVVGLWRGGPGERLGILLAVTAVLLADMVGATIKDEVERLRPFNAIADARVLVGMSSSYSFPSNHAVNTAAAALVLGITWRRHPWVSVGVALSALSVGYSRVYVGVHYPVDVVTGMALGVTVGGLVLAVTARWPVLGRASGAPWKGLSALVVLCCFLSRMCYAAGTWRNLTPAEALAWAGSVSRGFSTPDVPPAFRSLLIGLDAVAASSQWVLHATVAAAGVAVLMAFHAMGRVVTGGHRGGFLALGLAASLPIGAVGSVLQVPAVWGVLLTALSLAAGLQAQGRDRRIFWWCTSAILATAAALFTPFAVVAALGLMLGLVAGGAAVQRRAVIISALPAVAASIVAMAQFAAGIRAGVSRHHNFHDLFDGLVMGWSPLVALMAAGLATRVLVAPAHEMVVRRLLVMAVPSLVAASVSAYCGGDVFTPLAMAAIPITLAVTCYLDGMADPMLARWRRRYRAVLAGAAMASGLALSVLLANPHIRRDWLWLVPPERDPAGLMVGWKSLARKVDNLSGTLPADSPWRVEAEDTGIAALLRYYSMEPQRVVAPGDPVDSGPVIRVVDAAQSHELMSRLPDEASCGESVEHNCKSKWRIYRSLLILPCSD